MTDSIDRLLILETEHTTICQAHGIRIPGYLIVEPRSECTGIADLDPDQAADFMLCLTRAEALVQALVEPERIYILKFGEQKPQIHFHVIPRTEAIAKAYTAEVPDEEPYNGAKVTDWIWARHESFGYTDEQLVEFVTQARQLRREGNE